MFEYWIESNIGYSFISGFHLDLPIVLYLTLSVLGFGGKKTT